MIFEKKYFLVNSILYVCLCLLLIFWNSANAADLQILTVDEIEKGALNHLASALPWEKESLEINAYYKGDDITLPPGKKELIYKIMGNTQRAGRIPLSLVIKVNENYKKRVRINSRVLVSQTVVKTIRSVRKGEILSSDNIQLETIQTERPWKNAMRNLEQVLGYEAGRNMPSGKILTAKIIKKPALGNKGDRILPMCKPKCIPVRRSTLKPRPSGVLVWVNSEPESGWQVFSVPMMNFYFHKF